MPTDKRRVCVAPMLDWTDRHCRYFHRLITSKTCLYTEMVTTGALIHGDAQRFLRFSEAEHPVAFQLGGSEPANLAKCAKLAEAAGYDEVNLNCGCPSERVQKGAFGACLMKESALVKNCLSAIRDAVSVDVSVKHRIGVDDSEDYAFVRDFIGEVSESGCRIFIVHARKAFLKGLSPKDNRDVPPLDYETVYRLKKDFPDFEIIINGGVESADEVETHLGKVDGVMIGRAAYHNPWMMKTFDERFYGIAGNGKTRADVLREMVPYLKAELDLFGSYGLKLKSMTRHLLGISQGVPGARRFRQMLSDASVMNAAEPEILLQAAELISR